MKTTLNYHLDNKIQILREKEETRKYLASLDTSAKQPMGEEVDEIKLSDSQIALAAKSAGRVKLADEYLPSQSAIFNINKKGTGGK